MVNKYLISLLGFASAGFGVYSCLNSSDANVFKEVSIISAEDTYSGDAESIDSGSMDSADPEVADSGDYNIASVAKDQDVLDLKTVIVGENNYIHNASELDVILDNYAAVSVYGDFPGVMDYRMEHLEELIVSCQSGSAANILKVMGNLEDGMNSRYELGPSDENYLPARAPFLDIFLCKEGYVEVVVKEMKPGYLPCYD